MIDLFVDTPVKSAPMSVSFNTDSIFDLQSGYAVQGYDGMYYINGGWGNTISGVHGFGGMYKSTHAGSLLVRSASIYDVQLVIGDSEDAISRDKERLQRMGGDHPISIGKEGTPNQLVCLDCKMEYDLDTFFSFLHDLGETRLKRRKELTFTTPFIDFATGERVKTWSPMPIFMDSITEMYSNDEMTQVAVGLDDKKTKTVYMMDANKKTIFLRWMSKFCAKYGFVCCATAHYGAEINMDAYGPSPKQLQYMKQGFKVKGAGSKFTFLTSPQYQIVSCKVLEDDKHEAWYKLGDTGPTDINEVAVMLQRCKNNSSGSTFNYVISQSNGLLAAVTDYNYLRANKLFGLTGNLQNHQLTMYPDHNITRNTVRELSNNDKKMCRALQLTAQLLFIQQNWNMDRMPFPVDIEPQKFVDTIMSGKNPLTMDRLLCSRGYWLPAEMETKETPEYVSIFDALAIIDLIQYPNKK